MNIASPETTSEISARARRRSLLISGVGVAMVVSTGIRGAIQYPDVAGPILLLITAFVVTLLLEHPASRKPKTRGSILLITQMLLTIACFVAAPVADYWAILLLPSIIFAVRYNSRRVGIAWAGIQTLVMIISLEFTEGWLGGLEFSITYLIAFILVGSYALMLKQTEASESEMRDLLGQLADANLQLRDHAANVEDLAALSERQRLARDLHDSVTQTLFSITLIARSASVLHPDAPDKVSENLEELHNLSQDALSEMRSLIAQLRPVGGDSLFDRLRRHADIRRNRDGLLVNLDLFSGDLPGDDARSKELFRIVQEALNNIAKHAEVDVAHVAVRQLHDRLLLTIADSGRGFDTGMSYLGEPGRHIGLHSIRERCAQIGATLTIDSEPGDGTRISIDLPLSASEVHHG